MRTLVVLALALCACEPPPRPPAEAIAVDHLRRGGYILRDENGDAVTEREFGQMYEQRTGSKELRSVDHTHAATTVVGSTFGAVFLGASAATFYMSLRDGGSKSALPGGAFLLGAGLFCLGMTIYSTLHGNPEEHDLARSNAESYVRRYNDASP